MFTKEELIACNKQGFIAGPDETYQQFKKRMERTIEIYEHPEKLHANVTITDDNKIKKPFWSWSRAQLKHLFDFSPEYFLGYFHNKNLRLFEGAATWQVEEEALIPILQVKKSLKKGSLLQIYQIEEILSHEAVHAARIAFNEPIFEEHLAYLTSSSFIRRIFGPIFQTSKESLLFVVLLVATFSFQALTFVNSLFFFIFSFFSMSCFIYSIWGLIRLFKNRWILRRAYKKLEKILKDKKNTHAVLLRLTDREIRQFAKWNPQKISTYFFTHADSDLRIQQICFSYL